jgi:dipeptidyl aminopeptidase/acylaminoacyl peptidase
MALTGVMNVPSGPVPAGGFPVLILNHGLIYPDIYFSGRGSKREQDFFARHGYVTIHPDYRGYSSITPVAADVSPDMAPQTAVIAWPFYGKHPAFSAHHDFYEGYTADVLALIDALKKQKPAIMDISRIGMWGHSMGGGIAERLMVRTHDVRAYVLFAAISADAEDNFYELTPAETAWLHATYGAEGAAIYRDISPVSYAANVSAPVQIHHGLADADVPSSFSRTIFDALTRENKKTELFTYPGEQHEFIAAWPLAAGRALQFFDRYVKNAK